MIGGIEDLRVDEDAGLADRLALFRLLLLKVDHQHALGNADLDGGEADSGRGVHRVEHVVDQPAQIVVDLVNRLGDLAQTRVRNFDDRENGHAENLGIRPLRVNRCGA